MLIPLQSCSNTLIGEKLENSFDIGENSITSNNPNKEKNTLNKQEKPIIRLQNDNNKSLDINLGNSNQKTIQSKVKLTQTTAKSSKKLIFKPQPYRIILKLSGANPSAPAETVTKALRKAGVQFEVEKIERFDEETLLKNKSFKK